MPEKGGHIDELRPFVDVANDVHWVMIVAWIVAAFRPTGPYPVLVVNGEQGSAKSTVCRILWMLFDPNAAPLRSEPKEPRDLMIAATNAWCLMLENLSGVPAWLSDALCRIATGGGFATRKLYSDDEEKLFDAQRPVVLNGIPELATRPVCWIERSRSRCHRSRNRKGERNGNFIGNSTPSDLVFSARSWTRFRRR